MRMLGFIRGAGDGSVLADVPLLSEVERFAYLAHASGVHAAVSARRH